MHNSSLGGKVSVCRLRTAPNEQQFTRNGRWLSFTWHFVYGINQRVMKKMSSKGINTIISTISVQNNISWHNTNSSTDVVMFRYVTFKCHLKCWDKGTNNSNLTNILFKNYLITFGFMYLKQAYFLCSKIVFLFLKMEPFCGI